MTSPPRLRVIGPGRAGGSIQGALARVGWTVLAPRGRHDEMSDAAEDVDLVVIATPDGAVEAVAGLIEPNDATVIAHMAGSLGLEVLGPHRRTAALHPLVSLPDPVTGADRLASGAWFAVAGEPIVQRAVDDLGGRWFTLGDGDRTAYHAAAVVASNHLVALMGQVERLAGDIGVPAAAYQELARGSLDNVTRLGAAAALTGPVARGDWDTVRRHLNALDPSEQPIYRAMAAAALRLVDPAADLPDDLG